MCVTSGFRWRTPDDVAESYTSSELFELFDYYKQRPFGEAATDIRHAHLIGTIRGAVGGKALKMNKLIPFQYAQDQAKIEDQHELASALKTALGPYLKKVEK